MLREDALFTVNTLNTLKYIGNVLFAALLCATAPVLAAPNSECGERVLLAELVNNLQL